VVAPNASVPRSSRTRRAFATLLVIAFSGLGGASCSSSKPPVGAAKKLGLPAWTGTDRDLFGDELDPSALGILPPKPARKDQVLWARSQQAEVVGRVRVQTVTVDSRGGQGSYHLGLRFAQPLLAPTNLEEREFEVTVEPGDLSYGLIKAQDTGLQGRTFVGFIKRFAGADDEIEIHFYLAPDSAEVAAVVQEAVAVEEVTKK
jgi:hypothetical protein